MKANQIIKTKTLRAVGYCRTSGERQRDNTSISRQKEEITNFIQNNDWKLICFYADECKSGSTIEGRPNFQQMMRDAANSLFDVIVIYDIDRFARDGSDIISESKVLKRNFGVDVLDTRGHFDTRDRRNVMTNFIRAGMSEEERLRILDRMVGGRIKKAKDGLPWCANLPAGRGYDKDRGWYITEHGRKLAALLKRYVNGEPLEQLAQEHGFSCSTVILRNIHKSQLSGVYQVVFNSPEIGIENLKIAVPAIPQIITPELEQRVMQRLAHNRRCNKQSKRKYPLTGFVNCGHCGRALVSQQNGRYRYYRHYASSKTKCPYKSIEADLLEGQVLEHLFEFYLDEPAYKQAVRNALPTDDDRKALVKDIKQTENQLRKVDKGISNLAKAIAGGIDPALLLDEQDSLKGQRQAGEKRLTELNQTLAAMPDARKIQQQAMSVRVRLRAKYRIRDWRKLSYDEIRRFLHFLFSDNPHKNGYGIFVNRIEGKWRISFKGRIVCGDFVDVKPLNDYQ